MHTIRYEIKKPYRICSVRCFTKRGLSNGSIPTQSHRGTSPSHGFPRNGIPKHAPLYGIRYSVGEFHPVPYHRIISFFKLYESFKNLSRFFHGKYLFFSCNSGQTVPIPSLFAQNEGDEIQIFAAAGLDHFTVACGVFVILSDPVLPEFLVAFGFLNGKKLRVF